MCVCGSKAVISLAGHFEVQKEAASRDLMTLRSLHLQPIHPPAQLEFACSTLRLSGRLYHLFGGLMLVFHHKAKLA